MMRKVISLMAKALLCCATLTVLSAGTIYTGGASDGYAGRDWYSNPNFYWVDTSSPTISVYHDGSNRTSYRGVVIFNISSLFGTTVPVTETTFNFYSFGFSGVTLQYANAGGPDVTTGYAQAGGANIAGLSMGEGWQAFDVASNLQSSINSNNQYVSFIFNATVNYGGGSLAASEDPLGRGAYLQVGAPVVQGGDVNTPEPETMWLAIIGLGFLAATRFKSVWW